MANKPNQKPDAVVRRLYARGNWKLKSVAHFGGDETGIADMCLLKDADGRPFIPGASIAGASRSYLAKQLMTWAQYSDPKGIDREPKELKKLFGGAGNDDTMSALIIADATCVSEPVNTFIRDGVRIVAKSGTAAEGAKYDIEVVERGTEFKLEFVCIIREGDCESEFEKLFLALLHGFEKEGIRLGARTRRGYGRGRVDSWDIRDLKMCKPKHVMAWLSGDVWQNNQGKTQLTPRPLPIDRRRFFRIEADFALRTSLLIRSSSEDPKETDKVPDTTHLHSDGRPVVPGTSFAGVFRHRAALIADVLNWEKKDPDKDEDPVCEMFGPVHKQKRDASDQESQENTQDLQNEERDTAQQKELWASRVSIEERLVKRVDLQWQDRVAIDRFTGGSLQSALFNEKPAYPLSLKELKEKGKKQGRLNIRLRLIIEEPEKAEIGLLLLTLRDFWYGHAVLGGETSNGRGTLQGLKAKLIYKDNPDPSDLKVWQLKHDNDNKCMTIENGDKGFLQCCVTEAQNYSNCPSGSRRPKRNSEEESDAE